MTQPPRLVVAPAGQAFRTLSSAIDAAPPGAVIEVHAGLYSESLVLERPVLIEAVGKVLVDGGEQRALTVEGDRIRLRGLAFRRNYNEFGGEPVVSLGEGVGVRLDECLVLATQSAPALTIGVGRPVLERCSIVGGAPGVLLGPSRALLRDCEVLRSAGTGLEAHRGARPLLHRCRIAEGTAPALWLLEGGGARAEGCTFAALDAVRTERASVLDLSDCELLAGEIPLVLRGGKARLVGCRLLGEGRLALHGLNEARAVLRNCRLQARDTAAYWEGTGGAVLRGCELDAAGSSFAQEGARLVLQNCREV